MFVTVKLMKHNKLTFLFLSLTVAFLGASLPVACVGTVEQDSLFDSSKGGETSVEAQAETSAVKESSVEVGGFGGSSHDSGLVDVTSDVKTDVHEAGKAGSGGSGGSPLQIMELHEEEPCTVGVWLFGDCIPYTRFE